MKTIMAPIRSVLGWILTCCDRLTRPEPLERSPENQQTVENELEDMALYQFEGCPFCIKVRRAAHRLNLPLEYRDARNNPDYRDELKREGGMVQVPCLKIDHGDKVEWMYESDDIIEFLKDEFGPDHTK